MSKIFLLFFCFFFCVISREIAVAESQHRLEHINHNNIINSPLYCYAKDPTPYRRFGTSTSYLINANLDDTQISVPGCKPVMMWFNSRHGARGAHKEEIERTKTLLPDIQQAIGEAWVHGKTKLCHEDVVNLLNWNSSRLPWSLIYTEPKQLIEAGRKEMRELGQRMGKRFPDLLKDSQETERKASPEQRTHVSMEEFLMGLYGHPVGYENSTELMFTFNKKCPAFKEGVEKNEMTKVEQNKLKERSKYKRMLRGISDRIGVKLNESQVDFVWRICRLDIANFPEDLSPWCAVFSKDDLKLKEYGDDLKHYYKFGYYNISRQMTQPLMEDLYEKFSSLNITGKANFKAYFNFVHSRIAHSMVAALKLCEDKSPPLASDWDNIHTKWRTSKMLSFGHNLALVALQCHDSKDDFKDDSKDQFKDDSMDDSKDQFKDDSKDQFKVLAMHQERRISLADLCGEEICTLQEFLDSIKPIAETDYEKVCEWNDDMTVPPNIFG